MQHHPLERPSEINPEVLSWKQGGESEGGSEEGREGGAGNPNHQGPQAWAGSLQGTQVTKETPLQRGRVTLRRWPVLSSTKHSWNGRWPLHFQKLAVGPNSCGSL